MPLLWSATSKSSRSPFACRKGAAYGLAGVVKGLKISSVNGFGILDSLKASLEEKVSIMHPRSRDSRDGPPSEIHEGLLLRDPYKKARTTANLLISVAYRMPMQERGASWPLTAWCQPLAGQSLAILLQSDSQPRQALYLQSRQSKTVYIS